MKDKRTRNLLSTLHEGEKITFIERMFCNERNVLQTFTFAFAL
jgi:hypothetical protein